MTGDLLKMKLRNDTDYSSTGVVEFLQPLLDEFLKGHPEHVQAMFHNLHPFSVLVLPFVYSIPLLQQPQNSQPALVGLGKQRLPCLGVYSYQFFTITSP